MSDFLQEVGGSAEAACPEDVFQGKQCESDYPLRCFDDFSGLPLCSWCNMLLNSMLELLSTEQW